MNASYSKALTQRSQINFLTSRCHIPDALNQGHAFQIEQYLSTKSFIKLWLIILKCNHLLSKFS